MVCKNCDTVLNEETKFCNNCGAKIIRNRLTIKSLFENFSEQFLNYDNKFLQTFISLFTKPDDVIGGYINGTRKKYVNVISYFAIAITISGIQIYILSNFFPELYNISSLTLEGQEEMANNNLHFIKEYQSIIMMLYAPIYALMSRLVFLKNKTYNYAEHLVIFMYVLAQITIIGSIITLINALFGITLGASGMALLLFQLIYSAYCLKKLFSLSLKGILLKTLLFLLILLGFFIIFSIIYILVMIGVHGSLEEFAKTMAPTT